MSRMAPPQGRISTSGIAGIAPGREGCEVDQELVGVEADRHVEGEAGGDRGAGGGRRPGRKVTSPVVASSVKSSPRAFSTPPTATRTLPATGLAMARS